MALALCTLTFSFNVWSLLFTISGSSDKWYRTITTVYIVFLKAAVIADFPFLVVYELHKRIKVS